MSHSTPSPFASGDNRAVLTQAWQRPATLGHILLSALRRYPDRLAFKWEGGSLTYRATAELIGRVQAVYLKAGFQRHARVALLFPNIVTGWAASQAALCSGMACTWLHPMGSLDDQLFQLTDFEADILVVDAGVYGQRGEALAAAIAALPKGKQVKTIYSLGASTFGEDLMAASEAIGPHAPRDLAQADDMSIVNYTGGTTGRSKGAWRDHAPMALSVQSLLADFDLPQTPRFLAIAPISHVAGTKVLPTLCRGGTVHLVSGFVPQQIVDIIARERINMTLLVPTMIYALLDSPALNDADLSSLELVLYGASSMSPSRLIEGIQRIGPVFAQLYGQTEGYPLTYLSKADHDPARPERFASCGVAVSGTQLALLDDNGNEVSLGEVGELCARCPQTMGGYLNLPDLSAEALRDGWLHTGDMARQDAEGYYYIVDRKKDMVVSGGFNVYPRDVEDTISSHPAVANVAVIGTPDAHWGEAVTALVTLRPGMQVSAEELVNLVKERRGSVQAPKRVEFVESLPTTALGKVDKKALRMRFWTGQDRQVA